MSKEYEQVLVLSQVSTKESKDGTTKKITFKGVDDLRMKVVLEGGNDLIENLSKEKGWDLNKNVIVTIVPRQTSLDEFEDEE